MRSPQPLTNRLGYLRDFNKKTCNFSHFLLKIYLYIFIAKIPSTCNRNLDLSYLVNPSGLFYDNKYSSNDKYNGPSSVGHN